MPLRPNIIERLLIRFGFVPGIMLDGMLAGTQAAAVVAAAELDLFREIKDRPLDVETLAERLEASPRGIGRLADVLEGLGYLEAKDGRYTLTGAARRSLPVDLLHEMAPFIKDILATNIEEAGRGVREAPEEGVYGWERVKSGPIGRGYQVSMRWLASDMVDEVVGAIDLPDGARRMLDVGGSHGLYTVEFCREHPALRGTIVDWPIGLENAKETLKEETDVADRIDLCERDFEREELPTGYDFAFLGNIVHGIDPEGNRELFRKLARATTDRGMVAILDQTAGTSGSTFTQALVALFGFNLFLFSGGRAYPYEDLRRRLQDAGFSRVEHKGLRKSPGMSLVIARKAA